MESTLTESSALSSTLAGAIPVVKADARIPALDGLRGVASLMVVAYHFGPHIVREESSRFLFLRYLPALWFGGVDLFFVLSGFLISGILVNARESSCYFSTFYVRRFFRIFPLYYVVFLSYGLGLAVLGPRTEHLGRLFENPLPLWSFAFYLQNFAMAAANTFGPIWMAGSWSLAVEEQFYLTLPAIIRRVGDRGLLRLAITGVIAAPLLRGLIQKFKFASPMSNYVLLPTRVDSLAIGVLVMLLLRYRTEWLHANRRWIAWSAFALFLTWTVYPYVPNSQAIRLAFINHTVTAVVFGSILLCVLIFPTSVLGRLLSASVMRTIGNMAYSTYLLHPILLCLFFRMLRGRDPLLSVPADLPPIAIAGLMTLALSWLSWSQFETRLIRVGHRFHY